jgi:hypothetical protein
MDSVKQILEEQKNKSVTEIIDEQQDLAFKERIRQFNLVGDLTSWRTNMKDNTRRGQILSGRKKIIGIISKKW